MLKNTVSYPDLRLTNKLGGVDVSRLIFVRDKSVLIAAILAYPFGQYLLAHSSSF
jgi:hypothetical protein